MRTTRALLAFIVIATFAASLHAQCGNVSLGAPASTTSGATITLNPQYPADTSRIEIVRQRPEGNSFEVRTWSNVVLLPINNTFSIPRSSDNRIEHFTLNVLGGSANGCSVSADIPVTADAQLASVKNAIVVPVAGSTPGANGAKFKTILTMTGVGSGTIYFRRQGSFAGNSSDPSLRYTLPASFQRPGTIVLDDVVGQMGTSGIGSLDIVPDVDSSQFRAPFVDARVYNDAPTGRFGSSVPVLVGSDLFTGTMQFAVSDSARARTNVGVRTFGSRVTADIAIATGSGTAHILRTFEANTFQQMTLADFVHQELGALTIVGVTFSGGPVAAYYSETDNGTNDPTVFVPAADTQLNPERVGAFIVP
jgi:hypothetical protein